MFGGVGKSITVHRNSHFEKNKEHVINHHTGKQVTGENLEVWFGDLGDRRAFCLIMDKNF